MTENHFKDAAAAKVDGMPPSPSIEDRSVRRAPKVVVIMMGLVLVAAVVLGGRLLLDANNERTDDASVVSDIIPLAARASGVVARVLVQEDQPVKRGDVLIELDERVETIQVAQAETELSVARAQLKAITAEVQVIKAQAIGGLRGAQAALAASKAQSRQVESRIAAAEADIQRAEKEAERAAKELERIQSLFTSRLVSQSQLDDARFAQEVSQASISRARAQLQAIWNDKQIMENRVEEAQGRLDQSMPAKERIAMAEAAAELATARVTAAEQALETAQLHRSFLRIISPRDGKASKLSVREGQFVQVGQALVQLVANPTIVVANFKETQIQRIHPGQRATLYLDAYPDKPLAGQVISIAGGTGASFSLLPPNNASGNFVKVIQRVPVRIALSQPCPFFLQAGLSVEAAVHVR